MPRDAVRLLRVPRRSRVVALAQRGLPSLERRAEIVGLLVGAYLVANRSNTNERTYPLAFLTGVAVRKTAFVGEQRGNVTGVKTERF